MKYPRTAEIAALASVTAIAAATPALAADVPTDVSVTGGTTTLKTAKGIKATGGKFKITGGRIDPATGAGAGVTHTGKVTFRKGMKKVTLRSPRVNGSSLIVGGKAVARLSGGSVAVDGFDPTVRGVNAKLTKAGAKALKKLGRKKYKAGKSIGRLTVSATAGQALVASGTTQVKIAPAVAQGLQAQGAGLKAAAPATLDPATLTVSVPVSGGVVGLVEGQPTLIDHAQGGLTVTKDYKDLATLGGLQWIIDGTADQLFAGAPLSLTFANVSGAQTTVDQAAKTATGSTLNLALSQPAADALKLFQLTLPAGAPLGVGSYSVTLK